MKQIFESHSKIASSKVSKSIKTTDLALTMALLVIVFSVSGGIVTEAFQDSRRNKAQVDVEHIAMGLFEHSALGRGPASVNEKVSSEISEDPWGQPFRYRILKGTSGSMKVVVVSAGPNKKFESNLDKFETETHAFGGDDIGFIYDGSNKKSE